MADSALGTGRHGDQMQSAWLFEQQAPMRRWRFVSYGFDRLLYAMHRFALEQNIYQVIVPGTQSQAMTDEVKRMMKYHRKACKAHLDTMVAIRAAFLPDLPDTRAVLREEREECTRIIQALVQYITELAEDPMLLAENRLPAVT